MSVSRHSAVGKPGPDMSAVLHVHVRLKGRGQRIKAPRNQGVQVAPESQCSPGFLDTSKSTLQCGNNHRSTEHLLRARHRFSHVVLTYPTLPRGRLSPSLTVSF